MPDISHRLRMLRRLPQPVRLGALVATIPVADEGERRALGAELLELLQDAGTARWGAFGARRAAAARGEVARGLLGVWGVLPIEVRAVAVDLAGDAIEKAGVEMARAPEAGVRKCIAGMGRITPFPWAILAAGDLLFDEDASVADEAEAAVGALAGDMSGLAPESKAALDGVLAMWAGRYDEHRRRGALAAVVGACQRPGPRLRGFLEQPGQPAHMALRGVVKKSPEVCGRAACVQLLGLESLAGAAFERLSEKAIVAEHEAALKLGHLLLHPERRRRMRGATKPAALLPARGALKELSESARVGVAQWIGAMPDHWPGKGDLLASFVSDGDGAARYAAVRAIAGAARLDKQARSTLGEFARDGDARIAWSAAAALCERASRTGAEEMSGLMESEHGFVREAARRMVAEGDPWALIDRDEAGLDRWSHAGAMKRAIAADREGVIAGIRARIAGEDGERRVRAILVARRVRVETEVELELLAAAASGDVKVAASAVRALAAIPSRSSRQAVSKCVEHPDGRVRATAVEAVGRIEPTDVRIIRATGDEHARTRANAIRARLVEAKDPSAERALAEMLGDDRAGHRLSALWVTERTCRLTMAERVGELATVEADDAVRLRAGRCARRLLAQMREQWSVARDGAPGSPETPGAMDHAGSGGEGAE